MVDNLSYQYATNSTGDLLSNRLYSVDDAETNATLSSGSVLESSTYYVRDAQGNVMGVYEHKMDAENAVLEYKLIERNIYGSAQVGICKDTVDLNITNASGALTQATNYHARQLNHRQYSLSNHLGNVLTTLGDGKAPVDSNSDGVIDYYVAYIISVSDYSPFGVELASRTWSIEEYRNGFNGKEKADEIAGTGNHLTYGDRGFDPRRGQWWSIDKAKILYPDISPYVFTLNTPIQAKDPNGKLVIFVNGQHTGDGGRSEYWVGFDKKTMVRLGDHKAMYFDGALGGWSNTAAAAASGGAIGSISGGWGMFTGAAIDVINNSNVNHEVRIAAGYKMGQESAKTIFANLKPGEGIKVVTHSMGTAFSRGMVDALTNYYNANKTILNKKGIKLDIQYQLDVNAFDGEKLSKPGSVVRLDYMSGTEDWLANPAGYFNSDFFPSSKILGGKEISSKGAGHSITDPIIQSNTSQIKYIGTTDAKYKREQPPIYEQNPK